MSGPISRGAWVKLYKQLQREANKFPQYNYRVFAQRRIRDHFEKNRSVVESEKQQQLYKKGQENLELLRRQLFLIAYKMRECVKCKSNEYTNKSLVMMINECGHPLCKYD
uniref:Complex1_LYR_dom domain-containing protein n=2 Tax=Heterorhabditis bacteriophora TaxID=37862 RepID=A0A1I7XTN7_HETBA